MTITDLAEVPETEETPSFDTLRLTSGRQDFISLHRQQISNDPNQLSQSDPLISIDLLPDQYFFVRSEDFIDKAAVTENSLITFA